MRQAHETCRPSAPARLPAPVGVPMPRAPRLRPLAALGCPAGSARPAARGRAARPAARRWRAQMRCRPGGSSGALVVDLDTRRDDLLACARTRRGSRPRSRSSTPPRPRCAALRPDRRDSSTTRAGRGAAGRRAASSPATSTCVGGGDPTLDAIDLGQLASRRSPTPGHRGRSPGRVLGRRVAPSTPAAACRALGLPPHARRRRPLGALTFNRGALRPARPPGQPRRATPRRRSRERCARRRRRDPAARRRPHARRRRPSPALGSSPPLADLVRLTNLPSDNFLAEMLLKALGAALRRAGDDRRRGRGRARHARRARRLEPRVVDGSGLSRANRTSAARGRRPARAHGPATRAFRASLAVAGRSRHAARGCAARGARPLPRPRPARSATSRALAGYCRRAAAPTSPSPSS